MIRRALLAPLRASTYRRAVFLLLGAVILLPYLLLAGLIGQSLLITADDRAAMLSIAVVVGLVGLVPPFLSGTRELEIAAVRALLRVDLPQPGPPALETRLRAALWFAVHLAVGAMIGTALVAAVPLAFMGLSARVTLASAGAALLLLLGTVYATAGLGALAATMAPVLLGPSPAERLAAVEAREHRLAERNRLARELHDSVGHALTATTLQAGAARAVFDKDPEFARPTSITCSECYATRTNVLSLRRRPGASTGCWTTCAPAGSRCTRTSRSPEPCRPRSSGWSRRASPTRRSTGRARSTSGSGAGTRSRSRCAIRSPAGRRDGTAAG